MQNIETLNLLFELIMKTSFSAEQEKLFSFRKSMTFIEKLSSSSQRELFPHLAEILIEVPFTTEQSDIVLKAIMKQQKHQTCICCLGYLDEVVTMITSGKIRLNPSIEVMEELINSGKDKAAYDQIPYQNFLKSLEESTTTVDS